jgi:hypothetical protein
MENRDRDVFGRARRDAILDKIHETGGTATSDVLDEAARIAQNRAIEKMGEESERRFVAYARQTDTVKSVRNASPEDDVYRGIDKWITLREDLGLPELPVQVKSSFHDARLYKQGDANTGRGPDPAFTRLHGMEIVLNCGRSVKLKFFKKQLHEETRRIKLMLKGNPSLVNFIKG